jgi:hypothetical protein
MINVALGWGKREEIAGRMWAEMALLMIVMI